MPKPGDHYIAGVVGSPTEAAGTVYSEITGLPTDLVVVAKKNTLGVGVALVPGRQTSRNGPYDLGRNKALSTAGVQGDSAIDVLEAGGGVGVAAELLERARRRLGREPMSRLRPQGSWGPGRSSRRR